MLSQPIRSSHLVLEHPSCVLELWSKPGAVATPWSHEHYQPWLVSGQDPVFKHIWSDVLNIAGEVGLDPGMETGHVSVILIVGMILPQTHTDQSENSIRLCQPIRSKISPVQWIHPDCWVTIDSIFETQVTVSLTIHLTNQRTVNVVSTNQKQALT